MKQISIFVLLFFLGAHTLRAQQYLTLYVTDADTKEELIGASIKVSLADSVIRGAITDVIGNARIALEPGTYTVEVGYTGYKPQKVEGVVVRTGQLEKLDVAMKSYTTLSAVEITCYKIPIVQCQTPGGSTLTSEQIKNLPTRSVNAIVATTSGTTTVTAPEPVSNEGYSTIVDNAFVACAKDAFSTFSIDVDRASYANVRRFINDGQTIPRDAVRIEEMINYFNYNYPQPEGEVPVKIVTELGKCPWNVENHLLMVGLQGREMIKVDVPPTNLVFLVDVSGSMSSPNKLPLVQQSLHFLLDQLRPTDRISLVTYAGHTEVTLTSTPVSEKEKIKKGIDDLAAGGGTAGAAGIQLAYEMANENFIENGNNRVILCTDGDFNVGLSSEEELVQLIEKERKSGVYLTVLGFGTGNYQDHKMQELADRGNGNHAYIDHFKEAQKVFGAEFSGTIMTIAKDVKLQLEFDSNLVQSYRLVGYENRMLAKEDFDNDAKDAGELGAGHTVTALYEIIPNKQGQGYGNLAAIRFRYKPSVGDQPSTLVESFVPAVCRATPSDNFTFAAAVAESGLLLRDSKYKANANWEHLLANARTGLANDKDGYRMEFITLMEKYHQRQ